ncbi:MAG: ABC transporter substrate-binding protein [Deinococcota bacterium]
MKKLFFLLILAVLGFGYAQTCTDGFRTFTHFGGESCVPEDPQRIVSLSDMEMTLILADLGQTDRIVGSAGRVLEGQPPFLRGPRDLLGLDYTNTDIEFVSTDDFEGIAALEPDLIVGTNWNSNELLQYEAIAPTVLLQTHADNYFEVIGQMADLVSETEQFEARRTAYEARIAQAQELIPNASDITVTMLLPAPWNGTFELYERHFALSQVIEDIGFAETPEVRALLEDAVTNDLWMDLSPERMAETDADFIVSTYEPNFPSQATPDLIRANWESIVPGYCDFLRACQEQQIIFVERTPVYTTSFASLDAALTAITNHIGERAFTKITELQ